MLIYTVFVPFPFIFYFLHTMSSDKCDVHSNDNPLAGVTDQEIHPQAAWFPSPQPSLSIDTLSSWIQVSLISFVVSWWFLVNQSFGALSVLSSITVCSFLLALLCFLGLSTRMTSEFYREHYGYNIPLGYRNIVYYSPFKLGILSFYCGIFLMIGIAAWTLMESNRILGSLSFLGLGLVVLIIGGLIFWYMIKHPIGIATDHIYTHKHNGYGGGGGGLGGKKGTKHSNVNPMNNGYLNYPHIVTLSDKPVPSVDNITNANTTSTTAVPSPVSNNNSNTLHHHVVVSGWIRKPAAVPYPVMETVHVGPPDSSNSSSLLPSVSTLISVVNEKKNP